MVASAAIPLAAFGLGVGAAELLGAANLGTALGIGQISFAAALIWALLRDRHRYIGEESERRDPRPASGDER